MKTFKIYFLKLRKFFLYNQDTFFIFLIFSLGIFLIIFSFLFSDKKNTPQPKYGGIYREAFYEDFSFFDFFNPKNDSQKLLINIIYPPLIEFDNGKPISRFIEKSEVSKDGLSYTFVLKNLKWSNGEEITSDDLLFSFKVLKKEREPKIRNLFQDIDLEVIDKKTVSFHLKNNDNYFFFNLKYFNLLPQKIFSSVVIEKRVNIDLIQDLLKVGSGPFVLEKWDNNKSLPTITLTRNNYYSPRPYLDKIIFYLYPSPKNAFDALLLKEVDGLAGINYFDLPSNIFYTFEVKKIILPRVIGIFFNAKKVNDDVVKFLDSKINRAEINKLIFNDYAEETKDLFSATVKKVLGLISTSSISNYGIGFSDFHNKQITLIVNSVYFYPDIARYLREQFNFKIETVDLEVFNNKLKNKDYDAILYALHYDHPPAPFYFWSQGGIDLNNLNSLDLERNFQKLINDPKINLFEELGSFESNLKKINSNIFLLNPAYIYFLNRNFYGFDQFYLFAPEARFVKIEYWFKKQ